MTRQRRVGLTVFGACFAAALAVAEPENKLADRGLAGFADIKSVTWGRNNGHTPSSTTGKMIAGGSSTKPNPSLSNQTANLFIDLLVHQVGQAVADGVTQGSASPVPTVTAGDGINRIFTFTISNEGDSMATGVILTDTWPSGFTLGNLTSSQGSCTPDGGNFTCALGDLAAGGSATISASYTVPATTPAGTQTNTISATSNTSGASSIHKTASKIMTVVTSADLSVSQSDGVTTATAGDGITRTYTITVSNEGPSMAAGVVLTDAWPSGFTLGNLTSSQGSCAPDGGNFTCALGNLAAGGSATISASYTVPATTSAGTQTNTVSVKSNTPGASSSHDTASKTTMVLRN